MKKNLLNLFVILCTLFFCAFFIKGFFDFAEKCQKIELLLKDVGFSGNAKEVLKHARLEDFLIRSLFCLIQIILNVIFFTIFNKKRKSHE